MLVHPTLQQGTTALGPARPEQQPPVDSSKPATTGVAAETNGVLLRRLLGAQVGLDFRAPAAWPAFEHVCVMQ